MKTIIILCALFNLITSSIVLAENRVALVIGNSKYVSVNELPNDINDARDMAKALQGFGFNVTTKTDATLNETLAELDKFGHALENGGVGLFYYSGHGLEVDGQQYIVPVDARLHNKTELPYVMVDVATILKTVGESKAHLNLVILDACRNNPFAKALGLKSFSKGFSPIQAPSGSLIASATAVGDTSSAAGDRNSVYTAHLLEMLRTKPSDEVRLLLGDVGDAVKKATGDDQVPWFSTSMTGRFYFSEYINPSDSLGPKNNPNIDNSIGENTTTLKWMPNFDPSGDPNAFRLSQDILECRYLTDHSWYFVIEEYNKAFRICLTNRGHRVISWQNVLTDN